MSFLLIVLLLVILVVVGAYLTKSAKGKNENAEAGEHFPYQRVSALFTPAERSFLGALDQAVGHKFRVFGKVRIADVVSVERGLSRSAGGRAFNKISAKHFDFVLCQPGDLSLVCVIELNDKSHQAPARQTRDDFVARVCQAAKLPFATFPAKAGYTLQEIQSGLSAVVSLGVDAARSESTTPALSSQQTVASPAKKYAIAPATLEPIQEATPTCSKCGALMVLRNSKSGPRTGESFWGCGNFPKCREVVQLTP